ncbi:MAG: hypothetical protein A3B86_01380 [Candidatus Yanofskybacteria bacterium RIFCSPHIGHO2_02_FULL_38_22b]|uniref:Uncharacterized protein n=1 Tax=Candidatus Yanofskybacteria bacterium RIFCSPHIGHO2_02_FULL_38_22b TaxID=1802673 RepID=A0A1F8F2N3_9BACT|nr:MAG: hypothetical protein A3B86_01380 [Candidatus Yanofskybacteria bacterium RIFCSPHIGHO2_02_FULL_38_22b]OGN20464.1 MAG: hypothetical protein A2910_02235 [Candidatus Yanofskybacteria bacterium RIFCSPLOWO2_01_FULL_39_28]
MLNKTKQQLADKLGELLAKSVFDDETKNIILENIDKIPEHSLYKLLAVLEGEQKEFDLASFDLDLFLKDQDQNWATTKEEQKKAAETVANKWAVKLV